MEFDQNQAEGDDDEDENANLRGSQFSTIYIYKMFLA